MRAALFIAITLSCAGAAFAQTGDAPRTPAITSMSAEWLQTPTREQMIANYPARAFERGVSGRVMLDCVVIRLRPSCTIYSETPADYAFGEAALRLTEFMRVQMRQNGRPVENGRLRLPVSFRVEELPPADSTP